MLLVLSALWAVYTMCHELIFCLLYVLYACILWAICALWLYIMSHMCYLLIYYGLYVLYAYLLWARNVWALGTSALNCIRYVLWPL